MYAVTMTELLIMHVNAAFTLWWSFHCELEVKQLNCQTRLHVVNLEKRFLICKKEC